MSKNAYNLSEDCLYCFEEVAKNFHFLEDEDDPITVEYLTNPTRIEISAGTRTMAGHPYPPLHKVILYPNGTWKLEERP